MCPDPTRELLSSTESVAHDTEWPLLSASSIVGDASDTSETSETETNATADTVAGTDTSAPKDTRAAADAGDPETVDATSEMGASGDAGNDGERGETRASPPNGCGTETVGTPGYVERAGDDRGFVELSVPVCPEMAAMLRAEVGETGSTDGLMGATAMGRLSPRGGDVLREALRAAADEPEAFCRELQSAVGSGSGSDAGGRAGVEDDPEADASHDD